jgi:hypothetical protein
VRRSDTSRATVSSSGPGVERSGETVLLRVELSAAELSVSEIDDALSVVGLESEEAGVDPGVGLREKRRDKSANRQDAKQGKRKEKKGGNAHPRRLDQRKSRM